MGASSDPERPPAEALSLSQAANLLGVSTKTVRRLVQAGDIPARKVGRQWRISRRVLLDWIAERHQP